MTPQPYELLIDVRERMVRIETKLDSHADASTILRTDVDDLECRVSKLESSQKVIASIGAILLFLVTFFQSTITALVTR